MSRRSFIRGNLVEFDPQRQEWVGVETQEVEVCKKCGLLPTEEGYDACLGHIEGAKFACCGHGVKDGYILWENGHLEVINQKDKILTCIGQPLLP
jgi:hypothetical protein